MVEVAITLFRTINQLLTAGVAITAFSLLFYALTFNLRDRVARSFALILTCVVIVFVGDAIGSTSGNPIVQEFWLMLEWVGIIFLPATYLHFSDAVLATTGRPSRWRRRLLVRLFYITSGLFLITLPLQLLVGPLVTDAAPAAHLERTWLTWFFTLYYLTAMVLSIANLARAYRRTVVSTTRRRMSYLILGALSPALGSYPYLLFGSNFATNHPLMFWLIAVTSNLLVTILLVLMAYAVAFFGVPWPDRVVKRRLFKWLMRGPVTASTVLAITTLVKRTGERFNLDYSATVPIITVGSILVIEHAITLIAPIWERLLFHGADRQEIDLLQQLEERLLTTGDLRQFLESILAAICDRLQRTSAFLVSLTPAGSEYLVAIGDKSIISDAELSNSIIEEATRNNGFGKIFVWGDFWLAPLYSQREEVADLLGLIAILHGGEEEIEAEDRAALEILINRAALALEDQRIQQQVFTSIKQLTPEIEMIQRLRAAARYNGGASLMQAYPDLERDQSNLARWVKDALTHYWGGPKLTHNPLMGLRVVQQALKEQGGNPANALRSTLRQAIERIRPAGERRFTGEWLLYNLLEQKFLEGKSVREVAMRLAMSEADLYRKQRVAIDAVAKTIIEMEDSMSTPIAGETKKKQIYLDR